MEVVRKPAVRPQSQARTDQAGCSKSTNYRQAVRTIPNSCVVGWNPAQNLCNSAPYNRFELLRKGNGQYPVR